MAGWVLGAMPHDRDEIVDHVGCPVAESALADVRGSAATLFDPARESSPSMSPSARGLLRYVVLRPMLRARYWSRWSPVAKVARGGESEARELAAAAPTGAGRCPQRQQRERNALFGEAERLLSVHAFIEDTIGQHACVWGHVPLLNPIAWCRPRLRRHCAAAARLDRSVAWSTPTRARVALPYRWRRWHAGWWPSRRNSAAGATAQAFSAEREAGDTEKRIT